jgi:hypothetical protein
VAKLNEALDEIEAVLRQDETRIFGTEADLKGFLFGLAGTARKRWRKRRYCVWPGCSRTSIRRSHTVQRQGPLAVIAENQHVLTPEFDPRERKIRMVKISIGKASTFPGFCSDHEKMFFPLEQGRELTKNRDVALQMLRTICRELVIARHYAESLDATLLEWEKVVNHRVIEIFRTKMEPLLHEYPSLSPKSFRTKGISHYQQLIEAALSEIRETARILEMDFLPAALADVEGRSPGMAYFALQVEQSLPVCLAGLSGFHVQSESDPERVFVILNIWPTTSGVTITTAVLARHDKALHNYLGTQLGRSLGPLEMVETWMVHGSDHWFIQPSSWEKIPVGRRERILRDILSTDFGIAKPYERSILDEVRKAMLALPVTQTQSQTDRALEIEKLRDCDLG